ncbi:hypothetical protein BC008_06985 [Mastigocoleus testarum BC008]|uniref:Uncharacterized protein n=1 Tax=Mastigocoleus testarum BC008 TaxID=371196 RepID=A0A0V7ZBA0_9CYAN|nr:hypothetical protein BC008_06985 [Mastigocoleus testarum BC008]
MRNSLVAFHQFVQTEYVNFNFLILLNLQKIPKGSEDIGAVITYRIAIERQLNQQDQLRN